MKRINPLLNRALWIAFIALSPITLIGLIAQNSIPGEFMYPIKLGFENAGLFIFAYTPESYADYNTTLTERRFDEAEKLLVQNSNTTGLTELVKQTEKSADSAVKVEDIQKKQEIKEKLIKDITEYQERLTKVQQSVLPSYQPTPTPITYTTTYYETRTIVTRKTVTRTETIYVTPTPVPPRTTQTDEEIVKNIEDTKHELEEIKQEINATPPSENAEPTSVPNITAPAHAPQGQNSTPPTLTPTPTPSPTPTLTPAPGKSGDNRKDNKK